MPFCSECKKAREVEHLNQNECLTSLQFSEIVGKSQKEWIEQAWYGKVGNISIIKPA
jgi:hypothetical protein